MNITIKRSLRIGEIEITVSETIAAADAATIDEAYARINAQLDVAKRGLPKETPKSRPTSVHVGGSDTLTGVVEYCALKQGAKGGYYIMKIMTDDDVEVWAKVWSSNAKFNHRKGDRITYNGHYEEYKGNTSFIIAQSKQERDAENGAAATRSKPKVEPEPDDLEDDDVPF